MSFWGHFWGHFVVGKWPLGLFVLFLFFLFWGLKHISGNIHKCIAISDLFPEKAVKRDGPSSQSNFFGNIYLLQIAKNGPKKAIWMTAPNGHQNTWERTVWSFRVVFGDIFGPFSIGKQRQNCQTHNRVISRVMYL